MTDTDKAVSKSSILKKINALRGECIKLDWTKEGYASFGKSGFKYLPTDKIKANIAPLVQKHGLELNVRFYDLQFLPAVGSMSQHVVLCLDVVLIDIETGGSVKDTVYGEAADSGDKAVVKAQTYAIKTWASQKFLIADGMDPDAVAEGGSVYKPKGPQEKEEVRSKILEQGVPPVPPVPAPKKPEVPQTPVALQAPVAPEPKVEASVEKPAVPEMPTPKTDVGSGSKTSIQPLEGQPTKFKISAAQNKAMDKITTAWEKAAKAGEVTVEAYNEMSMARATVSSTAEVMEFINKYKM